MISILKIKNYIPHIAMPYTILLITIYPTLLACSKSSETPPKNTPAEEEDKTIKYGYAFHHYALTALPEIASGSVYLGRPQRPNAKVIFIECAMDKHIQQPGWHNWGKPDNEKTAFYAEYKSTGADASIDNRVSWSHQLTTEEAKRFTYENVIGDRYPEFVKEKIQIN